MKENVKETLKQPAFNLGRSLLLVCEERTLQSFKEKPPPFEVVGWVQSFYEADRWVAEMKKRYLVQRRYINCERSDPKWPKAVEKGQIKII